MSSLSLLSFSCVGPFAANGFFLPTCGGGLSARGLLLEAEGSRVSFLSLLSFFGWFPHITRGCLCRMALHGTEMTTMTEMTTTTLIPPTRIALVNEER